MTRVYYKYATAAVIVYDLSRPATLHSVLKWKADLAAKVELPNGRPLPVLLVANKCDLGSQPPNARFLSNFCQEHGFAGWFPTSAKEDINISEQKLRQSCTIRWGDQQNSRANGVALLYSLLSTFTSLFHPLLL